MAVEILFEGTVAKHVDTPDDNEDAYCIAPEHGRVVVSDGASESFDARNWSRLLVDHFLDHEPSVEAFGACAQVYAGLHDPNALSWSKAAAYERGSFATLIIAQDDPDHDTLLITALGDSLAVWSDGTSVLETAPYIRADQFDEKPFLLATRLSMNATPGSEEYDPWHRAEWRYDPQGHYLLLCMTDALGAWLLRHQEECDPSAFERLRSIRGQQALHDLVEVERAAGRLRRDDTTLIIAALTRST